MCWPKAGLRGAATLMPLARTSSAEPQLARDSMPPLPPAAHLEQCHETTSLQAPECRSPGSACWSRSERILGLSSGRARALTGPTNQRANHQHLQHYQTAAKEPRARKGIAERATDGLQVTPATEPFPNNSNESQRRTQRQTEVMRPLYSPLVLS